MHISTVIINLVLVILKVNKNIRQSILEKIRCKTSQILLFSTNSKMSPHTDASFLERFLAWLLKDNTKAIYVKH